MRKQTTRSAKSLLLCDLEFQGLKVFRYFAMNLLSFIIHESVKASKHCQPTWIWFDHLERCSWFLLLWLSKHFSQLVINFVLETKNYSKINVSRNSMFCILYLDKSKVLLENRRFWLLQHFLNLFLITLSDDLWKTIISRMSFRLFWFYKSLQKFSGDFQEPINLNWNPLIFLT